MSIIDDIDTSLMSGAKIKVIGVGGAGGSAVQAMINANLEGVDFVCMNTDSQALAKITAPRVQLGEKLTRGLGAGSNPDVGKKAADESINSIREAIEGADMVFITAGMGGGTGTGAAPVIAQAAKDLNALTVGVVSKPFGFEGKNRMKVALQGLEELAQYVDSLIIVPNDRLLGIANKKTTVPEIYTMANNVLLNAVRGISDVIMCAGDQNVDFADVKTIMAQRGLALMGTGRASGENRAREATQQAIMSPLLEDVSLENAKGILYNITTSHQFTVGEFNEIGNLIHDAVSEDPNITIKFGVVYDDNMGDDLQLTVIATGIEPSSPVEELNPVQTNVRQFRTSPVKEPAQPLPSRGNVQQEAAPQEDETAKKRRNGLYYEEKGARLNYPSRDPLAARQRHTPGKDTYIYNDEDYDIPAFIKYQAD